MRPSLRLLACATIAACLQGPALAGHDPIKVDRAFKRYGGQVTALGEPDEQGRIFTFKARRVPAGPEYAADELRGWRLTMLAGKRFAQAFEVQRNTGVEITVGPLDGPLNGIAVNDVFVVEDTPLVRAPGRQ